MDTKNTLNEKTPDTAQTKKPYQAPTLRFENVFEVSALNCGKLAGETGLCISIRKTS